MDWTADAFVTEPVDKPEARPPLVMSFWATHRERAVWAHTRGAKDAEPQEQEPDNRLTINMCRTHID